MIELGAAGDKSLSARLGRVMGDPNLVVAFPVERGYVDEQGHAVTIAGAAS